MVTNEEKEIIASLSLIKNIIKYIVPDNSDVVKRDIKKQSKLEEEVLKHKETKKRPSNLEFLEQVLFELKTKDKKPVDNLSININKKREANQAHFFVIKYQENESEETLEVEAKDKDGKKYSIEIRKEKLVPDEIPYQLDILYENKPTKESLEINYNLRDYPKEREKALQDFTNQLDKSLHIFPKSMMGGVLGFTYLGENFMGRRDDLSGDEALMVDVHEAIHTPDEYETRVITDWMITMEKVKYKK